MAEYLKKYGEYLIAFERYLFDRISYLSGAPEQLILAMRYSLEAGGKRIRPILLLSSSEMLGADLSAALPFAAAVEMIHTYSLIHDDLPAMDNDDYRRGKLTNHKVFGEAMAILAGDALLNLAYEIAFNEALKGKRQARAGMILAESGGFSGMIGGQAADLLAEKKGEPTEAELRYIHKCKTAKLIQAPLLMGQALAGIEGDALLSFGENLGLLFQFTDDILDVTGDFENLGKTIGKDKSANKLTAVNFYGLNGARDKAREYADNCFGCLSRIDADTSFLKDLTINILERDR